MAGIVIIALALRRRRGRARSDPGPLEERDMADGFPRRSRTTMPTSAAVRMPAVPPPCSCRSLIVCPTDMTAAVALAGAGLPGSVPITIGGALVLGGSGTVVSPLSGGDYRVHGPGDEIPNSVPDKGPPAGCRTAAAVMVHRFRSGSEIPCSDVDAPVTQLGNGQGIRSGPAAQQPQPRQLVRRQRDARRADGTSIILGHVDTYPAHRCPPILRRSPLET